MMKKCFAVSLLLLFANLAFAAGNRSIAVLLDTSKSIPVKDFQVAREAVLRLLQESDPQDQITLYTFGNALKKMGPVDLKEVQPNQTRTDLYDAAYDVAQSLSESASEKKAILILSDGNDTSSATILEDSVGLANAHGIVIYGIGLGKTNRRSLERLAKLTGGKLFVLNDPALLPEFNQAISAQKEILPVKTLSAQGTAPPQRRSTPVPTAAAVSVASPVQKSSFPYLWVAIIFGTALLAVVGVVVFRAVREQPRLCPDCGRKMQHYETVCTVCSSATINSMRGMRQQTGVEELIPKELLEKKPVTEEDLSKTFVLLETPMLVVKKGRNLGQSFALHRAYPVSIGRSKVNEVLLDDVAVSGQHCRIIPENGKHVLYDLGSTNGTFLNDRKVQKAVLNEGDTIKIGETYFVFRIEQHRN